MAVILMRVNHLFDCKLAFIHLITSIGLLLYYDFVDVHLFFF
uniref:Uncharacterized protein n=1 Tax=Heterorhabditis bacteriophora TaxID=37862 RepID=A0A1I7X3V2_HETBA